MAAQCKLIDVCKVLGPKLRQNECPWENAKTNDHRKKKGGTIMNCDCINS